MSDAQAWQERYAGALMNTFGPPKLTLERGKGAHVWDTDGKEYVDLLGGIAVNSLGHGHPALVSAVTGQLETLGHISNFFASEPQIRLAEKLLALLSPSADPADGRVFFANSGAEANEAAFKLTRRTGRTHVVAAEGGFHGRTMGALALTSKEAYRDALRAAARRRHLRAVRRRRRAWPQRSPTRPPRSLLEPMQGEAGVVVPPEGYLVAAREIATQHGALLWLDEVQTGIGRTGHWFAHETSGVTPDVVTVAKGLAGGFPDRRLHRARRGRRAAAARQPRHDLRRQPGRLRRRPRGHRHHRVRRPARARDRARPSCSATGLAADPRVTEVRGEGLLIGLDLSAEALGRRDRRRAAARLHHQQPDAAADPAGARRWC